MSQNSNYFHKSHNITVLLYDLVTSENCRRVVFTKDVDQVVYVCTEIEKRYDIQFLEIRTDDYVPFLLQSDRHIMLQK